jgi:hypothetical protein
MAYLESLEPISVTSGVFYFCGIDLATDSGRREINKALSFLLKSTY